MAVHLHRSWEHPTNICGPHTVLDTGRQMRGKIQTDLVLREKKIKQLFAVTLDECYDKVNKASLESNSNIV